MTDSTIDFATGAPAAGSLAVSWIHGAPARRRASDPPIQVHRYDEHTVILRQSKSVHYEAPFLYLLFGNDRALLLDTGATADPAKFPLRATVDELVGRVAGPAPARRLPARRGAHARPRRPRRGRRAVRRAARHDRGQPRARRGQAALRLHRLAGADRAVRPGRTRARGHRQPRSPPGRDHRLRPVDRFPAHRRHRVPGPPLRVRLPAVPGQPGPDDRAGRTAARSRTSWAATSR